MKIEPNLLLLVIASVCLSGTQAVIAQAESSTDDVINVNRHPVHLDPGLDVATARLGEGRLHQVDATLVEIPPGGKLPPHRHLAEEIMYIVAGEGHTDMWIGDGAGRQRYDWDAGDLLSPSLNTWHQHFNASAENTARYISITTAPITHNIFPDQAFLTSSNFVFEDRWQQGISQQPEYTPEGGFESSEVVRMRVGHQLPDLPDRKLRQRRQGAWGITILPEGDLAGNHVLEMEVREKDGEEFTDEQAHLHHHPWEVIYIVLDGQGYSDMRREGEPMRRVNWQEGDLFIVEANEYHDNRARPQTRTRYLQVKAAGYFRGVGNVGGIVVEGEPD
jgi:quercetin dioxygenase-like cupin family protein